MRLVADDRLAALGQQIVQEHPRGMGMVRLFGDDRQPRQHHGIILRHHDLDVRVAFRPQIGIGTDDVIADGMFARADLFQHRPGRGVELGIHRAEGRDQRPQVVAVLGILVHGKEAQARPLGVIGGDLARHGVAVFGQPGGQARAGVGHFALGDDLAVIDHHHGFVGGGIDAVAVGRPVGNRSLLGRGVFGGDSVLDHLVLQIHRRGPDDVGLQRPGGGFAADAAEQVGGLDLDIVGANLRERLLEIGQDRLDRGMFGIGIDHDRAFGLGSGQNIGVIGGIARRNLGPGRDGRGQQKGRQKQTAHGRFIQRLHGLPPWRKRGRIGIWLSFLLDIIVYNKKQ
ncbi:hypothetical protein PARHAE_01894 [Paracoccus haematequi]|uniref:NAD-specific glutamate dehydrogenase n=1 Tax=Paracoccus haematequi TaxID=2491866 RepID=A0A447IML2_9RHOB|nr:hypothetical protein PARHAE_01894 [Paracoccus haematequi]